LTDGAIGMSDGTVVNIVADLAARLDETVQDIIRALASCGVLNADETGVRICGKLAWMQIISSEKSSLYGRNPTRGTPNDEMNGLQNITYYTEERRLLARLAEYIDEHLRFISDFPSHSPTTPRSVGRGTSRGKRKCPEVSARTAARTITRPLPAWRLRSANMARALSWLSATHFAGAPPDLAWA